VAVVSVYIDPSDGLLVINTVPVVDRFGWTTFAAMVRKQTSQTVNTKAGADAFVITLRTSPSNALQSQVLSHTRYSFKHHL